MGITAKPVGKLKSRLQKVENELKKSEMEMKLHRERKPKRKPEAADEDII